METTSTTAINVAYPEAGDLHLRISVGACRLRIKPGEGEAWVTGTYRDLSGALPPKIVQAGGTVRITQGYNWPEMWGAFSGPPTFDLVLGKARPYALTLEAGGSETDLDLGGLPITRLVVRQGAGKYRIDFSAPNPQAMSLLDLDSGAGDVEITGLGNANAAETSVDGGAAAYRFDFGGTLQRDGHVRISAGLSMVEIRVPATTAAKITPTSVLGSLDVGDGFTKKEGAFWTEAALAGKAPVLTIHISVALGALRLQATPPSPG